MENRQERGRNGGMVVDEGELNLSAFSLELNAENLSFNRREKDTEMLKVVVSNLTDTFWTCSSNPG